jgi:cytochrome P450
MIGRKSEGFPLGGKVSLTALNLDPFPILRELQDEEPVSWIEETEMWYVTRREDVLWVLKNPDLFSVDSPASTIKDTFGEHMLSTDGPRQSRYKKQCTPPFTTVSVRRSAAGIIEDKARELIDAFIDYGFTELQQSFASQLSVHTVATILGLPPEVHSELRPWYDDFAAALANFSHQSDMRDRGLAAVDAFNARVKPHLYQLEQKPDNSLLGALAGAMRDRFSEQEIVSNALIILFGGIETTESMILNATWSLLSHPSQFGQVLQDPDLLGAAIEESLRWEPPVQSCTRYATKRVTIRGIEIEESETVQCMISAANRDPRHFTEPDRFDIRRANAVDHLAFGAGSHFCLGAPLARLETHIALRQLFDRLPGLMLDAERPTSPRGYEFRKPPTLHVRWTS